VIFDATGVTSFKFKCDAPYPTGASTKSLRPFIGRFAGKGLSVHAKAQLRCEMNPGLRVESGEAQQPLPARIN
jgi:hypothetical protein